MWLNFFIVVVLVLLSGTFAGLTLALFSLQLTTLERKVRLGDEQALKVYRIRQKGNLLLCTLLLGNVASYTVMAVFLGSITSGVVAGFTATALIFMFGEILPQAVFPRYALQIGARLSGLVWLFLVVLYPIAFPVAWLLDRLLGKEPPVLWSKAELREIIRYHKAAGEDIIDQDEERILLGALSFSELQVKDILIPAKEVYALDGRTTLDVSALEQIRQKGFSRIPVLNASSTRVVGILYAKDLIGLSPGHSLKVEGLCSRKNLVLVKGDTRLDDLFNLLVSRKMHMALVVGENEDFEGIATMEDIMEEILSTELEDIKA